MITRRRCGHSPSRRWLAPPRTRKRPPYFSMVGGTMEGYDEKAQGGGDCGGLGLAAGEQIGESVIAAPCHLSSAVMFLKRGAAATRVRLAPARAPRARSASRTGSMTWGWYRPAPRRPGR